MKITTFNPDGTIKDVSEYHFQIPEYITSFNPNRSFLGVSEEDVAVVSCKRRSIDKKLLIDKFRFLIKYDFNNFIQHYPFKNYIDNESKWNIHEDKLKHYDQILSSILRLDGMSVSEKKLSEDVHAFLHSSIWINTVLYHTVNVESRSSSTPKNGVFDKLVNIIHWFYYSLRKADKYGSLDEKEQIIMHTLYPFANIQVSRCINSGILDNDTVLAKMIESLYQTNEECRESLYAIVHIIEMLSNSIMTNVHSIPKGALSMMTPGSNNKDVTIEATPSNGIEVKEIVLPEEEIVCLKCPHITIAEEIMAKLGDNLKTEYNLFYDLNSNEVETDVKIDAARHYKSKGTGILTKKDWHNFYFFSLDKLENDYKAQYNKVRQLEVTYYYHYLLVEKCYSSERYEFKGYFLESLAYMAVQKKCKDRSLLYLQMLRLNYMEEEATIINKETTSLETNLQKLKMENLRHKLFNSEKGEIAKSIYEKRHVESLNDDELIDRVFVFLSPLFDAEIIVRMEADSFKEILKKIFQNEVVLRELRKKDFDQSFNVKLVLNIIGYLSEDNDGLRSVVKNPPIGKRKGNSLIRDLDYLWNTNLGENYRKCITQFDHFFKKKSQTYTVFKPDIKRAIDYEWVALETMKEYIDKAKKEAAIRIKDKLSEMEKL